MLDGTQSQIRLRPKRAASYLKTPIRWRPSIPTILSIIFSVELMAVLLIPDILKNRAFILLVGLSIPIGGWLLFTGKYTSQCLRHHCVTLSMSRMNVGRMLLFVDGEKRN